MLRPATNVQSIDRTALKQRSSVKITKDAPRQERIAELMRQIDPYCYLDGDVVVISRFADTDVSITDCCKDRRKVVSQITTRRTVTGDNIAEKRGDVYNLCER